MRLLLDTHSFLWFIGGDKRLSNEARDAIENLDNDAYLSVGSLWEIAVKINVGKLRLPHPFGELIPERLVQDEIDILPIALPHVTTYVDLPLHHRDPFDRLIIAQAHVEEMTVVTRDGAFKDYEVDLLW